MRPALLVQVDPDRWVRVMDGQRYVRKVRANGTATVDYVSYSIGAAWIGKYVTLRLNASERAFDVEYREQAIKQLPIKGLVGQRLPLEAYLEHLTQEARTQMMIGRPIGQQLRQPL